MARAIAHEGFIVVAMLQYDTTKGAFNQLMGTLPMDAAVVMAEKGRPQVTRDGQDLGKATRNWQDLGETAATHVVIGCRGTAEQDAVRARRPWTRPWGGGPRSWRPHVSRYCWVARRRAGGNGAVGGPHSMKRWPAAALEPGDRAMLGLRDGTNGWAGFHGKNNGDKTGSVG